MQAQIRRRSVYFGIALAVVLAWLGLSGVYVGLLVGHADMALAGHRGGDALFPRLRQLDALWAFVGLTLFQLLVLRENEKRWTDAVVWLALLGGAAFCIARQWAPLDLRFSLHVADGACAIIVAGFAVLRMAAFLSGRRIEVGDVWAFVGLQWMLVWTGANAYLTWTQNPLAGISDERRLLLFELATLGMGVHVLAALGLRSLKSAMRPVVRQRAGLLALVAYNVGTVVLLCGLRGVGAGVMLAGVALLLPALWPEKGKGRSVDGVMALFAAALAILPWESSAFSAWRHGIGAGVVALGTLVAAIVALRVVLPKRLRPTVLSMIGLTLFMTGVATRMATEILMGQGRAMPAGLAVSAALEIAGAALVSVALVRGMRMLGARMR